MPGTASEQSWPAAPHASSEVPQIQGEVLVGLDRWLYLHGGAHRQFAFLLSERSPRPADVRSFWSNLESRALYCRERRLPYLHVVFPSKPVVMTRFLPAPLRGQVQSLYRRSFLPAAPSGAADRVFYPDEELRALDATDRPFLETDTHLSDPGRALVAQAVLARWNLGYRLEDHFERGPGQHQGDLSKMLGEEDPRPRIALRDKGLDLRIHDNRQFLPGNASNIMLVHSPRSVTPLRLAVIGDSFFRDCLRFLAPVFRDILYLRGPGFHAETLDRFAPHAVMSGNAEGYLDRVEPDCAVPDIRAVLTRASHYLPDDAFTAALAAQLSRVELSLPLDGTAPSGPSPEEALALQQRVEKQEAELARTAERLRVRDEAAQGLRQRKDARIQALQRQVEQRDKRLAEVESLLRQAEAGALRRMVGSLRRALGGLRRR